MARVLTVNDVLDGHVVPDIERPTAEDPALRFGDPRVMALAGALCNTLLAAAGITSKSLRALMTGLPAALTPLAR